MKSPFPQSVYRRNADVYRVMANPKRLEILNILRKEKLPVQDLCRIVGARKANISQHLAVLRANRLVKTERKGLYIYYSISDPRIVEPCRILKNLFQKNHG